MDFEHPGSLKIQIVRFNEDDPFISWDQLPQAIFKHYMDRDAHKHQHSLKAWLILKETLKRSCISEDIWESLVWNELGKPLFKNHPVYFSLSHTDNFIAVSIGNMNHGIDIEPEKSINAKDYHRLMHTIEKENLNQLQDPKNFFSWWTLKEAWSKMDGGGLFTNFKKTIWKDHHLFFQDKMVPTFHWLPFPQLHFAWAGESSCKRLYYLCQDYGKPTTIRY